MMRDPVWARSVRRPKPEKRAAPAYLRDRLAVLAALITVVWVCSAFILSKDTQFLMPGPLTSAHGAIENCSTCHTKSGSGKLSWLHGLVAGDPAADSRACLTCHKMPDTAFYAHGASADVLERSTERLSKLTAGATVPQSARAQSIAFPTDYMVAHGVYCATCHQEHQGANFSLNKISNEQCHACHVVKFDSFDGHHPEFEKYPFKRRTRIIYDHASHFGKHFLEVAKRDPAKRIPSTCSTCHGSGTDKRIMAVAPFEQTCAACHLDQIAGKERASGPKGIAFLALPGLDLLTLKRKKASIGEWPEASEADLTPFMKVMISRSERGRALIKVVDRLNLQDLSGASDSQIKAVTNLVWEIKRLFYALILGKAQEVLADLDSGGVRMSPGLIGDLIASIPRDVVVGAQQDWLPNLGAEMANRQAGGFVRPSRPAQEKQKAPASGSANAATAQPDPSTRRQADAANRESGGDKKAETAGDRTHNRLADQNDDLLHPTEEELRAISRPRGAAVKGYTAYARPEGSEVSAKAQPRTVGAANGNTVRVAQTEGADRIPAPANTDQTDDLLHPTEDELRGIAAPGKGAQKAVQPEGSAKKSANSNTASTGRDGAEQRDAASKSGTKAPDDVPTLPHASTIKPQTRAAPTPSIQSDVDPEAWAEYGGWYRQDYAIFYHPITHKDKFIHSWLVLTGPKAAKDSKAPAAAVFDSLSGKDAQGACTKCHSIDDIQGRGRVVNFSPPSVESKQGRFTNFIHEPHFGVLENRGCLTCHALEKGRPYLQSYEQGNPRSFVSNFGAVKKELCQTCHTASAARQDCLLCHKYHVNGVITPIMNTKVPAE